MHAVARQDVSSIIHNPCLLSQQLCPTAGLIAGRHTRPAVCLPAVRQLVSSRGSQPAGAAGRAVGCRWLRQRMQQAAAIGTLLSHVAEPDTHAKSTRLTPRRITAVATGAIHRCTTNSTTRLGIRAFTSLRCTAGPQLHVWLRPGQRSAQPAQGSYLALAAASGHRTAGSCRAGGQSPQVSRWVRQSRQRGRQLQGCCG